MLPTPASHPGLGWNRLQGTLPTARGPYPFNYPHLIFAIVQHPEGGIYIHAINTQTGARMDRPCTEPNRAFIRVLDWARNGATAFSGMLGLVETRQDEHEVGEFPDGDHHPIGHPAAL